MDHTPVDLIVVDERHRLPIGRPDVTAAIDVCGRYVVGLVVTLDAPSATSVGLCLAHMVTAKRAWLERLGMEAVWPMSGKRRQLYVDNAAEFKSEALRRGCEVFRSRPGLVPRESFDNLQTALESRAGAPSIVHVYPGAQHGFGAAARRSVEVNARACAVSWPQTLAFITETAGESAP